MIILYTEFRSTYMEVQVGILGLFTTNRCEKKGKKNPSCAPARPPWEL